MFRRNAQLLRDQLLCLHGVQRDWTSFGLRFLLRVKHFGYSGVLTSLQKREARQLVEYATAAPTQFDRISFIRLEVQIDGPVLFRRKITDLLVTFDDEAKCRELARSVGDHALSSV